eukprot:TRINITY_DN17346_c0_g1_i1.p1 TRINITY_DN17346_c0_g1~~TRINITY_DN17346_c0_g1_i1.p1  ORF type:complete len:162 (-),score=5.29 TRINITY_DN17346_c0_g1_i1:51-536(-)
MKKRRLDYKEAKNKLHKPLNLNITKHIKEKDMCHSKDSLYDCAPTELNSSALRYSSSLLNYFKLQIQQRNGRIATYQQNINSLDTERGERYEEEKSFNTVVCTQPQEDTSDGKHSQAKIKQAPSKRINSQPKSIQLKTSYDSIANKPVSYTHLTLPTICSV